MLDCVSAQMTSISELQEHRYTLRTSPRRAAPARSSPTKNNSPCRENGQVEENNLSPTEKNVPVGINNINGSPKNSEEIKQNEKERNCNTDHGSDGLRKPLSEARLVAGYIPSAKESANNHTAEDDEEEPDVYYFESDHVALKHNKEYV